MKKKFYGIMVMLVLLLGGILMPSKTQAAAVVPGKVKMVSVTADETSNQIHVVWDRTQNATNYVLYYKETKATKWKKMLTVDSSKRDCVLTYKLGSGVKVGTEYTCMVRAYNKNSKKYGKYERNGIKFKIVPETVGISSISLNKDKTGIVLQWKKGDGSKITRGNYCYIYRKEGSKWKQVKHVKSSVSTYTDKTYKKGAVNTYMVRVYNTKTKTWGRYDKTGISLDLRKSTPVIVNKTGNREVILKGRSLSYTCSNASGTVSWSSSNSGIVYPVTTGTNRCELKAINNGTATITARSGNTEEIFTVIVASGNDYVDKWVKNMARSVRLYTSDCETQLLLISQYLVGNFAYGDVFDMQTVISTETGNCYSVGQVMVKIYNALGYKAEVRSAIHDDSSRYPSNMIMGSDHYNVKVTAGGRTYYLDASPQSGITYLSSETEVLAAYGNLGGGWFRYQ